MSHRFKILMTAGAVAAKLDAVKYVTNRFKGGRMAQLADEMFEHPDVLSINMCPKGSEIPDHIDFELVYLCSKDAKVPDTRISKRNPQIVHFDDFYDYQTKVLEYAADSDIVILGAAVANLLPVCYYQSYCRVNGMYGCEDYNTIEGNRVELPLTDKFPSHNYVERDEILMKWRIAPRVIDQVKAVMKPGGHLFGFKLLSDSSNDELVEAAYETLIGSKATAVFANDASDLRDVTVVTKDHAARSIPRSCLSEEIFHLATDTYYRTEIVPGEVDQTLWMLLQELADMHKVHFRHEKSGMMFGTIAYNLGEQGFVCTGRGKRELDELAVVTKVTHDYKNWVVHSIGHKASLNAPLLDRLFKHNPNVKAIVHYHDQVEGLPTQDYEMPGTVRDAGRYSETSFNIEAHGCILMFEQQKRKWVQV